MPTQRPTSSVPYLLGATIRAQGLDGHGWRAGRLPNGYGMIVLTGISISIPVAISRGFGAHQQPVDPVSRSVEAIGGAIRPQRGRKRPQRRPWRAILGRRRPLADPHGRPGPGDPPGPACQRRPGSCRHRQGHASPGSHRRPADDGLDSTLLALPHRGTPCPGQPTCRTSLST